MKKIETNYWAKPIPIRSYDWQAIFDDYEAESDSEGWWSTCPMGHGATEAEAIADLLEQAED